MKFTMSRKGERKPDEHGVWVSLDDEKFEGKLILDEPGDGPAVRVCSLESRRYKDGYDKGVRQYQRVIQSERFIPWYIREKIENIGMQEAITAWLVSDTDGKPVEFTKASVLDALENEPDFRKRVFDVAGDLERLKKEGEELDTKNLPKSSPGTWNGEARTEESPVGTTPLH